MAEGEEQTIEGEEINQKPEDSEKVMLSKGAQKKELELIESRKCMVVSETEKIERLNHAKLHGQNFVIDFQFADLMNTGQLLSLSQQIMKCYAVNSRCASPAHLWMTGCTGEIEDMLSKIPGIDNWIISTEETSYIEVFKDHKDKLVYLTADAETVLDDLDLNDYYIIGGLINRYRWKGIPLKKAQEQGIRTAKLPIEAYLKELNLSTTTEVLPFNHVMEILIKYLETKDWKASVFKVIQQRKRPAAGIDENKKDGEDEESADKDQPCQGHKKIKISSEEDNGADIENQLKNDDVEEKAEDKDDGVAMEN